MNYAFPVGNAYKNMELHMFFAVVKGMWFFITHASFPHLNNTYIYMHASCADTTSKNQNIFKSLSYFILSLELIIK